MTSTAQEREAFERWAQINIEPYSNVRNPLGVYIYSDMRIAWKSWVAARATAPVQVSEEAVVDWIAEASAEWHANSINELPWRQHVARAILTRLNKGD